MLTNNRLNLHNIPLGIINFDKVKGTHTEEGIYYLSGLLDRFRESINMSVDRILESTFTHSSLIFLVQLCFHIEIGMRSK